MANGKSFAPDMRAGQELDFGTQHGCLSADLPGPEVDVTS